MNIKNNKNDNNNIKVNSSSLDSFNEENSLSTVRDKSTNNKRNKSEKHINVASSNDLENKVKKQINKKNKESIKRKGIIWTVNITIITFLLALFFSFLAEITAKKANVIISFILLFSLMFIGYIFDAIGVATTASEEHPFHAMASRKEKGSKMAIKLIKNADKVSSICCDVIGDICGIISGACSVAIVFKLSQNNEIIQYWLAILLSSLVCALTVGGKSLFKIFALKNSKIIVLNTAKFLSIFSKNK